MLRNQNQLVISIWAVIAAFSTYFCMYAFRKPFTATTYEPAMLAGMELKTILVLAQLSGYAISKIAGVKFVSEMPARWRTLSLLGLIGSAEIALLLFAVVPTSVKPFMLFANGLPLGMVFGLVMSYLEGRRQTEALAAGLCASFIVASGAVKSVGQSLIQDWHVNEYWMPFTTGLIFVLPLLVSVWMLRQLPPPTQEDRKLRTQRPPMMRADRIAFMKAFLPGMLLLLGVYIGLTGVRSLRDDFGVEIWKSLGYGEKPAIFTYSETWIAVFVMVLNAGAFLFRRNRTALHAVFALMVTGFAIVLLSIALHRGQVIGNFAFMVLCGVGLYIPYVAFHTTVFERLIAASRRKGNLGFFMCLSDAVGYVGYTIVLLAKHRLDLTGTYLSLFQTSAVALAIAAIVALISAQWYFAVTLPKETAEV